MIDYINIYQCFVKFRDKYLKIIYFIGLELVKYLYNYNRDINDRDWQLIEIM